MEKHRKGNQYRQLLIMSGLSFIAMFILMYAMVDVPANVVLNWNQVYMAGLMTAPMVIIELIAMRGMYPAARWNAAILAGSVLAGTLCFMAIRVQAAIDDRQLLRSMIPHHAGAILMCAEASLENPVIQELCGTIIEAQRREIAQMRELLEQ